MRSRAYGRVTAPKGIQSLALLALLAGAFAAPADVIAECSVLDAWPSFQRVAPSASTIVVGEVVESFGTDPNGNAILFALRVDETLRGAAESRLEFHQPIRPPGAFRCPGDSSFLPRVGDLVVMAFGPRDTTAQPPVVAVAFIRHTATELDAFFMPGLETLTLAAVRAIAALPQTDTRPDARSSPPISLLAAAGLAGLLVALRWSRGRTRRSPAR